MEQDELKRNLDKIYKVGFKNGQIEMKNKVLKKINRNWNLLRIKNPLDLAIEIIKIIDKIK